MAVNVWVHGFKLQKTGGVTATVVRAPASYLLFSGAYAKNICKFLAHDSLLQNLQQPTTCPYPVSHEIQRRSTQHTSLRSILILSSLLLQANRTSFFPSRFPTKILYTFLSSHIRYMPHVSPNPWSDHPNNIWWGAEITKLIITQFSLVL